MVELNCISVEIFDYPETIQRMFDEKGIITVQNLIDFHQSSLHGEEFWVIFWPTITQDIKSIVKWCEKHKQQNFDRRIPMPYTDSSLESTDLLNMGDVLLFSGRVAAAPTTKYPTGKNKINSLSMAQIKRYIQLCAPNGTKWINFLQSRVDSMGPTAIPIISDAIDMYTEQVERQYKLPGLSGTNVFAFQREQKQMEVNRMYSKIIHYLFDYEKKLVWGNISATQRQQYLSSISDTSCAALDLKRKMITAIADYTILPELTDEIPKDNYKSLRRFIR